MPRIVTTCRRYLLGLLMLNACTPQSTPSQWARQDLNYVRTAIRKNHPGMYNDLDPDFAQEMDRHYEEAARRIANARNNTDAEAAVKYFVASFHDTHLKINFFEEKKAPAASRKKDIEITLLRDRAHVISLPTFDPDEHQQEQLLNIISQLPKLRSDELLIFDIRGNGGGNSAWAADIVYALFGKAYAQYHIDQMNAHVSVDWRASQDNITYLQKTKADNRHNFTPESDFMRWLTNVIQGMQEALERDKPYFTEIEHAESAIPLNQLKDPVSARIIVLIDRHCASAALDFIDYLKAMNHPITLAGETTGADSLYMECRTFDLPSKKGKFCIPIKVYRNRTRGHNEPYITDVVVHDGSNADILKHIVPLCL